MEKNKYASSESGALYLDAETEITEAIEKLKKLQSKEIRLVAPSRSGILQSLVNIKLLKKAAKDSDKSLILVTNDKTTKNLAGLEGVAVASSVKALAHVPVVEELDEDTEDVRIGEEPKSESSDRSTNSSDGDGFKSKHISLSSDDKSAEEEIEDKTDEGNKQKGLPDYNKLNKKIWIAILAALALVVLILLYVFVPSGKVNVLADAKKTSLKFNFTLDSKTDKSDINSKLLAAKKLQLDKDVNFEISATGKKEVGNKATGTISVKNCDDVSPKSLPSGTGVTSGGKSFTTVQTVTVPAGSAGGGVVNCSSPVDVQITATAPGDQYNLGPSTFTLTGYSSLYKATGQTSGGSSRTITVLSQEDIANARKQAEGETSNAKTELTKKAGNDQQLFEPTIRADIISFTPSVQEGAEADKVSINSKVVFTGFTSKKDDVNALFDAQIKDELKGDRQIYQNGSEDAKYSLLKQSNPDSLQMSTEATAYYGDFIDKKEIAKSVAGKSKKEVSTIVKQKGEQITGAEIESWPSLLPNMPLLSGRITVDIKVTTK